MQNLKGMSVNRIISGLSYSLITLFHCLKKENLESGWLSNFGIKIDISLLIYLFSKIRISIYLKSFENLSNDHHKA